MGKFRKDLGCDSGYSNSSGFFLRMHYTADIVNTFNRVVHIMRDVPGG